MILKVSGIDIFFINQKRVLRFLVKTFFVSRTLVFLEFHLFERRQNISRFFTRKHFKETAVSIISDRQFRGS